MDPSSSVRSEQITAIVSTVLAVILLAAGVTAQQSRTTTVDRLDLLDSDLRFQLEMGFRQNPQEGAARLARLEEVTREWQQSPQSAADREKLAGWLLEATVRSMPGSIEELPANPPFGETAPAPRPTEIEVVEPVSSVPVLSPGHRPEVVSPVTKVSLQQLTRQEPLPVPVPAETTVEATAVPDASAEVSVNLTELDARILGYNDCLEEVESRLLMLDSPELEVIAVQIEKIDTLTRDLCFISLYYDSLTAQERRRVGQPSSLSPTVVQVERWVQRIAEAEAGDFLSDFDASQQSRRDVLQERLTAIVERLQ